MLNKPAIELALSEVAEARGMTANIIYINSEYDLYHWQYSPYWMMKALESVMPKPYVCIVAGADTLYPYSTGPAWNYARAWYTSYDNFAIAGGETFWALNWGDDDIMPRDYPYWGFRLNRKAQMGLILHEFDHILYMNPLVGHGPSDIPWERMFY